MSLTSYRAAPPRGDGLPWCPGRGAGTGYGGTARRAVRCIVERGGALVRSGGDLLSRALRRSTIGAGALNGRVRDGIGCVSPAMATRPDQSPGGGRAGVAAAPYSSKHQLFQVSTSTCATACAVTMYGFLSYGVWRVSKCLRTSSLPCRHWIGSSLSDD